MTQRLESLVENGATITLDHHPLPLDTAALVGDGLLFYCLCEEAPAKWDRFLRFSRIEDDGYNLNFLDEEGRPVATICPVEDPDLATLLKDWRAAGRLPTDHADFIARERKLNNYSS